MSWTAHAAPERFSENAVVEVSQSRARLERAHYFAVICGQVRLLRGLYGCVVRFVASKQSISVDGILG